MLRSQRSRPRSSARYRSKRFSGRMTARESAGMRAETMPRPRSNVAGRPDRGSRLAAVGKNRRRDLWSRRDGHRPQVTYCQAITRAEHLDAGPGTGRGCASRTCRHEIVADCAKGAGKARPGLTSPIWEVARRRVAVSARTVMPRLGWSSSHAHDLDGSNRGVAGISDGRMQ